MTSVLIAYASSTRHTERMAGAVADGARSVAGTDVRLSRVEEIGDDDVRSADALIVGSPNHHQGTDPSVREFEQSPIVRLWGTDELVGKVCAVFATGGGFGDAGAGAELMMIGLLAPLAWAGMVFVPLPKTTPGFAAGGLAWGPWARTAGLERQPTEVDPDVLLAARYHGANVARVASALGGKDLFARDDRASFR